MTTTTLYIAEWKSMHGPMSLGIFILKDSRDPHPCNRVRWENVCKQNNRGQSVSDFKVSYMFLSLEQCDQKQLALFDKQASSNKSFQGSRWQWNVFKQFQMVSWKKYGLWVNLIIHECYSHLLWAFPPSSSVKLHQRPWNSVVLPAIV